MTRKTLSDAVLDVAVRKFSFPPKTFSAYQITKQLRDEVNANQYSIIEFEGQPTNFGQEVAHSNVRQVVQNLFDKKFFDRTFNGTYFEYAISINSPAPAPSVPVKPEPSGVVWDAIVSAAETMFDRRDVKGSTTLKELNADDLDLVEMIMNIEETLKINLDNVDPKWSDTLTLREIYDLIHSNAPKATQPVVTAPSLKTKPLLTATDVGFSTALIGYVEPRLKNNQPPSLKNAQKYLRDHGYQSTVAEIRNTAEKIGYLVYWNDRKDPFNIWTIRRKK